jgi:hypothetical protein
MPVHPLISHALTVTEQDSASLVWNVGVSSGNNDFLEWNLTVSTIDFSAQPWRLFGLKLEMDRGDGSLSTVKLSELGGDVTFRGSLENYGVREVSFSLYGENSPLKSSLLRGMRRVRLTVYRGVAGAVRSRVVFDGYTRDASFSVFPPKANITAQDTSIKFTDKMLSYSLDPGSLESRRQVILDVCDAVGITAGTLDIPTDGGYVFKPIDEPGDRNALDFLREFLVPIGCRQRWLPDGTLSVLNIKRYDTTATPVKTFNAGNMRSIEVLPPSSNVPNAVQFSGNVFEYTGPSGRRTDPAVIETTTGTYAPLVGVTKQDTAGTQTATGLSATSAEREISKTITWNTWVGGNLVEQVSETWGWYAPKAANKRTTDGGTTVTHNNSFDVWQYADGSWRTVESEQYQVIGRRHLVRTFDAASGYLIGETDTVWKFHATEEPLGFQQLATGNDSWDDVLITEDGIAWIDGKETLTRETNVISYQASSTGLIQRMITSVYVHHSLHAPTFRRTGAYSGSIVSTFGPIAAKKYGTDIGTVPAAGWGVFAVTVNYGAVSESQHTEAVTVATGTHFPRPFQPMPTVGTVTLPGPVPELEQQTSFQRAQLASATVRDAVRIALSGREVTSYLQNEFCENDGELRTAAFEELRQLSALRVMIETDEDITVYEGDVVAIDHPKVSYETRNALVWGWETSVGPKGQNSKRLECLVYPDELEQTA